MTDFFKFQVGPKPFLWLALGVGIVAEFVLFNWAAFAAWMNAYPFVDNTYWGYLFMVRASLFLVVALLCFWTIVLLVRIHRRGKIQEQGDRNA